MSNNKEPQSRITIVEVARRAGVSPSTVSLVIHGKGRVSASKRQTVRDAMAELGYVYNRGAANLRLRRSALVGVIVHDTANPFYAEMLAGAESVLTERGYVLAIANTEESVDRQATLLKSFKEVNIGGIIIAAAKGTADDALKSLRDMAIPVVLAVRNLPSSGFDFVGGDIFRAAWLAVEHLMNSGHKNVIFLGGSKGTDSWNNRFAAYCGVLESFGRPVEMKSVMPCDPNTHEGYAMVTALLESGRPVDGLFCYNDIIAFGALRAFRDKGIVVGRDVSVIGIDGIPYSEISAPPLTTVDIHPRDIGREAARLLWERITNPSEECRTVLLPSDLVIRESCMRQSRLSSENSRVLR